MNEDILDQWGSLVEDEKSLKILFYLREFNPNVTIQDLANDLEFEKSEIEERLAKIVKLKVIKNDNGRYKLTKDGRNMVNGFYHDINEPIPEQFSYIAVNFAEFLNNEGTRILSDQRFWISRIQIKQNFITGFVVGM